MDNHCKYVFSPKVKKKTFITYTNVHKIMTILKRFSLGGYALLTISHNYTIVEWMLTQCCENALVAMFSKQQLRQFRHSLEIYDSK